MICFSNCNLFFQHQRHGVSLKFFKVKLFSRGALCRHVSEQAYLQSIELDSLWSSTFENSEDAFSLNDAKWNPTAACEQCTPTPTQDLQRNIHNVRGPVKNVKRFPPQPKLVGGFKLFLFSIMCWGQSFPLTFIFFKMVKTHQSARWLNHHL